MNCVASVIAFLKVKDMARAQPLPSSWPSLGPFGQPVSWATDSSSFSHDAMVRRFWRAPFRGRLPAVLPVRIFFLPSFTHGTHSGACHSA